MKTESNNLVRRNPMVAAGKRVAWSEMECIALCDFYRSMLSMQRAGTKFNKAAMIRELQCGALSERSRGSIESKAMNVSALRQECGLEIVTGYKAFGNAQALLSHTLATMDTEYSKLTEAA
jgi:5-methylcytosine-specific restriction protein A